MIRTLFWASRPVSWVNTAYPFAAAFIVAGGWPTTSAAAWQLAVGTLFFLVPYNLLMYGLNDIFDYESDLRNPRKGGIEGALLPPSRHRLVAGASVGLVLPFLAYLLAVWSPATNLWLALFLFTVVAYSARGLRFKEVPLLDSLTSSSHFVGPMLVGLSAAGFGWQQLGEPRLLALIAAFTLWGCASHAFGAIQDILADREAGIASIATWLGARRTAIFATAAYLAAAVCALGSAPGWAGWVLALAGLGYAFTSGRFIRLTDATCALANRGWRAFLWLNYCTGFLVTILIIVRVAFAPLD